MKYRVQHTTRDSAPEEYRPPGYTTTRFLDGNDSEGGKAKKQGKTTLERKVEAAWGHATGAWKNIIGISFMLFMSGKQLNMFTIMGTFGGIYQPISGMMKVNKDFKRYEHPGQSLLLQKIVFCLIQSVGLAFAAFKLNSMGLLPLNASDWVSALPVPEYGEISVGSI